LVVLVGCVAWLLQEQARAEFLECSDGVKRAEMFKQFQEAVEAETYLEYNKSLPPVEALFSTAAMEFQPKQFYLKAQLEGVQMELSHSSDKAAGKIQMNSEYKVMFPLAFEASNQSINQQINQPLNQSIKQTTKQIKQTTNNSTHNNQQHKQTLRMFRAGSFRSSRAPWPPLRRSLRPFN